MSAAQIQPRLIRPVQDPLGLFIRVARGDSQCVQNFLEIKGAHFHGVVIDPTRTTLDKDVRDVAAKRKLDIVLDPKTQESAFNGSFTVKLGKLPWGAGRRHEFSYWRLSGNQLRTDGTDLKVYAASFSQSGRTGEDVD